MTSTLNKIYNTRKTFKISDILTRQYLIQRNTTMSNNLITALIVLLGLFFLALAIYAPMSIVLILGVLGGIGLVRFTYLTIKFKISQTKKMKNDD